MIATVTDRGTGPADPFAGLLPTTPTTSGGIGLWLTHEICSDVTLARTDDGYTIRLVAGQPHLREHSHHRGSALVRLVCSVTAGTGAVASSHPAR